MLQIVFQMLFNNLFFRLRELRSNKNNSKRLFYHLKTLYYENYLYFIKLNQRFIIIITV